MIRRKIRISKGMLITSLTLVGLICIILPQGVSDKIHLAFVSLYKLTPSLSRSLPLASVATTHVASSAASDKEIETQNRQLKNYCQNLWAELTMEHKRADQLAQIRTRFPAMKEAAFVSADVMKLETNSRRAEIVINRGSADGIREGQYVMADSSIIGVVSKTLQRTATVKLITDKSLSIPVEVAGAKVARLMVGDSKGSARIKMVPKKYRIDKGVAVYACKKAGVLDAPFTVGTVQKLQADDDNPLLWVVFVKPAVNFEEVTTVNVIVMNN